MLIPGSFFRYLEVALCFLPLTQSCIMSFLVLKYLVVPIFLLRCYDVLSVFTDVFRHCTHMLEADLLKVGDSFALAFALCSFARENGKREKAERGHPVACHLNQRTASRMRSARPCGQQEALGMSLMPSTPRATGYKILPISLIRLSVDGLFVIMVCYRDIGYDPTYSGLRLLLLLLLLCTRCYYIQLLLVW